MAVLLILIKGPDARRDFSWMARAIRSLPTPLSPPSRTVELVGAIRSTVASTSVILGRMATMLGWLYFSPRASRSERFSSRSRELSSSLWTTIRISASENGFRTESLAPAFIASTAVSTDSDLQRAVFFAQSRIIQLFVDDHPHFGERKRLQDVVAGTRFHRLNRSFHRSRSE